MINLPGSNIAQLQELKSSSSETSRSGYIPEVLYGQESLLAPPFGHQSRVLLPRTSAGRNALQCAFASKLIQSALESKAKSATRKPRLQKPNRTKPANGLLRQDPMEVFEASTDQVVRLLSRRGHGPSTPSTRRTSHGSLPTRSRRFSPFQTGADDRWRRGI